VSVDRVLIVTESFLPSINGVTNSVLRILETFKSKGIEAIVVAPTSPKESPDQYLGFPIIRTNYVPFAQFPVAIPGFFLRGLIEDFKPDVIHVASPFMLGYQAIFLGEQLGIPTVAVYQTDLAGYAQRYGMKLLKNFGDSLMRTIHSAATFNLAPTPEGVAYLKSLGVKNVAEWGRGVDLTNFHPNRKFSAMRDLMRSEFATENQLVVGFVGRLNPEKQVARMKELLGRNERLSFLVVGDGPERAKLEADFAGHPVHFTGKLTGEKLYDAYACIDIFVHFGVEETFGQTIQEAKANAIPVIAPNSGGPKFLIRDGVDGFLVEPNRSGAYATVVDQLLADDELRNRVGEAARRSVLGKDWQSNNEKLIEYYQLAANLVYQEVSSNAA